jgi:hypothetical protein
MRVKKFIILAVIVLLPISTFVSGRYTAFIHAMTRPSPDTAAALLIGIDKVFVYRKFHLHGDRSDHKELYKDLYKIDWCKDIESQLKKSGLKIEQEEYADGLVLLDIDLAKSKATEFVAVNLRLSFVEALHLDRIPIKGSSEWRFNFITWQSSKALILHRNDLQNEVQNSVQIMVGYFCSVFEASKAERLLKEHETPARK